MTTISKSSLRKNAAKLGNRQLLYLIVCLIISILVFGDLFAPATSNGRKSESQINKEGKESDMQMKKGEDSDGSLRSGNTKKGVTTNESDMKKEMTTGDLEKFWENKKPENAEEERMTTSELNNFWKEKKPEKAAVNIKGNKGNKILFHHYYKGDSGFVIKEMLMAHAYAYHLGETYGGSCGEPSSLHAIHESLLESIGLQDELKFACPRDYNGGRPAHTVPKADWSKEGTRIYTPEYVDHLKTLVTYPEKVPAKFTIAVHIRRGDVTPCVSQKGGYNQYLPNSHYQALIDEYMTPGARVVIFSQSKTTQHTKESFDEFRKKGYEIHLDGEITDVWRTIAVSDVVILSRSTFGFIPAVIAKGIIVYTPFWHESLPSWDVVNNEIMKQMDSEMEGLTKDCPTTNKWGGNLHGATKGRDKYGNPK